MTKVKDGRPWKNDRFILLPAARTADAERRAAALTVACNARSAEDLRGLLAVLGLDGEGGE